jgi:hypothetical protein
MVKFEILEIDLKKDIRNLKNLLLNNPTKIIISKIPNTDEIKLDYLNYTWTVAKDSTQIFIFTINNSSITTTILSPGDKFFISNSKLNFKFLL